MSYLADKLTAPEDEAYPLPSAHESHDEDDCDCLVPVPPIDQPDDYSCGACAAMAVGKMYGVGPNSVGEWKKALGTNKEKSTSPEAICDYLTSLGLQVVEKSGMTIDDLCYYHKLGIPVICPIQEYMEDGAIKEKAAYGHWVVVIGVGFDLVFVMDPSIDNVMSGKGADNSKGKMIIDCDEWMKDWFDDNLNGEHFNRYGIAVFPKKK